MKALEDALRMLLTISVDRSEHDIAQPPLRHRVRRVGGLGRVERRRRARRFHGTEHAATSACVAHQLQPLRR